MMSLWARWSIIIFEVFGLAACVAQPPPEVPRAMDLPAEMATIAAPAMPPVPPLPRAIGPLTVTPKVIGLNRAELVARFGAPSEEKDAAPAKILAFANKTCRVQLYLYFDLQKGEFVVLHFDVNDQPSPTRRDDQCLRSLASSHAKLG